MILQYTLFALAKDFVYAPLWWYTRGVAGVYVWLVRRVIATWHIFGIMLWMRHLFSPMFQQYDVAGRLISFFMRIVQVVVRSMAFVATTFFLICVFLLWILAPIAFWILAFQLLTHNV